jgi:putative spermidine/putrescine transport system permease protein
MEGHLQMIRNWRFPTLEFLVGLIALFVLFPLVIVVLVSFSPADILKLPEGTYSLRWYGAILKQPEFIHAFFRSLLLALVSSIISTVLGTLGVIALIRFRFKGRDFLDTFFMSPLMIPQLVIGIAVLLFFSNLKVREGFFTMTVAHVILTFPFIIRIVSPSLRGVNENLESAAQNLGADRFRSYIHITLPLIRPGLLAAFAFAFLQSFDNLTVSIFVAGPYFVTLPIKLYTYIDYVNDPLVASVSTVLILISVLFVLFFERFGGGFWKVYIER